MAVLHNNFSQVTNDVRLTSREAQQLLVTFDT